MWNYEKRLQYPVHITRTNAKAAQIIMSQCIHALSDPALFNGKPGCHWHIDRYRDIRYDSDHYLNTYKMHYLDA